MPAIIEALRRSLLSLGRARVWFHILIPTILAFVIMLGLSALLLDKIVAVALETPPMSWVAAWGMVWLAHFLASLGGWLVILSATYLTAILLAAVVVMPLLLNHVARVDYPDLARLGADSVVAATWNSAWAAVLFIVGWVLTLPLWLIPGLGLLLPLFWMAWLNRRTFAYDALSSHATLSEWSELRRGESARLFGLGGILALLTHVPFIGLFVPSLAALAYVHFCLEALRQLRQGAVVTLNGKQGE